MGLLQQASLVITPNAVKAGKLYSVIPTNGAGDLDVVRATSATRVDENGLIEIPATNLVLRSEEFNDVSWNKLALSVIVNSTTAPNGTNTADTILADGTNNTHRVAGNATVVTGTLYTISVYAKKNTNNFLQIYGVSFPADFFANFNLDTGTIGTVGAGATATITNIGNGWYRCTATGTPLSTGVSVAFNLINSITAGRAEGSTLSTSVYLWGAQLEQGITATEYIPTTSVIRTRFAGITQDGGSASNIPRLDYTNGSCPSILVEPQRTNLVLRSEEFGNNTSWFNSNATITQNTTISPSGVTDADTFTANGTSNQHYTVGTALGNLTSGVVYTVSVYMKKGTNNFAQLWLINTIGGMFANFDLNNGVVGSLGTVTGTPPTSSIQSVGNGWYRCIMTFTPTTTATIGPIIGIITSSTAPRGEINTLSTSVFLWGAQVEQGSNATSYIPTTTTSVTRNADVISKTGISSLIGQTEGTIYIDANINYTALRSGIFLVIRNQANANNRIQIFFNNNANNNIAFNHVVSGVANVVNSNIVSTGNVKIAIAYKSGQPTIMYINGVSYSTAGNIGSFTATIDSMYYGVFGDAGSAPYDGLLGYAMLFKTRLTNTELQQLTTL